MYHDELVPHFAPLAKTNAVIFYDQRGNGRSLLERINRDTFNVELMVEDLELLRQAFKVERLTLLGHSWGGLLALYYATKYPDNVERLIIIDAAPVNTELLIKSYENLVSRFTESEWAHLQEMYDSEEYQKGNPIVHNEAMRLSEGKAFYRKDLIGEFMLHASFDERTAKNMVKIAPLATEIKLNISVQDDLSRISCPVLIIHSRQDFIVEESPRLAHELLANSRIEYIENSGHYPFIEALKHCLKRYTGSSRKNSPRKNFFPGLPAKAGATNGRFWLRFQPVASSENTQLECPVRQESRRSM